MAKSYYEELGISRDANPEDIKKAYRKLARKYHPDVSKEADAEAKMQSINVAYDVLSNQEKKKQYDFELDHPQSFDQFRDGNSNSGFGQGFNQNTDHSGFDQNDFHKNGSNQNNYGGFENLFGRFGQGFGGGRYQRDGSQANQNRQSQQFSFKGEDQHARIDVDLSVAFEGATQTITLQIPTYNVYGEAEVQRKTLQVKIPKGMKEGQQIRLAKQGQAGINGGEAGDLYIEIQYINTDQIRVEGADIYYNIDISPWEAALGQDIEVMTPSGKVKVSIPKNTVYGKQLRLKDKGIPSKTPGHLYLVLNIVYPKAETEQQINAYQDFAQAFSHFNPRSN